MPNGYTLSIRIEDSTLRQYVIALPHYILLISSHLTLCARIPFSEYQSQKIIIIDSLISLCRCYFDLLGCSFWFEYKTSVSLQMEIASFNIMHTFILLWAVRLRYITCVHCTHHTEWNIAIHFRLSSKMRKYYYIHSSVHSFILWILIRNGCWNYRGENTSSKNIRPCYHTAYAWPAHSPLLLYGFFELLVWLWKYILNGYRQAGEAKSWFAQYTKWKSRSSSPSSLAKKGI